MQIWRPFSVPVLAAVMAFVSVTPFVSAQTRAKQPGSQAAAQPPANSPSLDDTLKWLADFLPTATGAKITLPGSSHTYQAESALRLGNGCQIVIATNSVERNRDGTIYSQSQGESWFSLSDIDPETISVLDHVSDYRPEVDVSVLTKNRSLAIRSSGANGEDRRNNAIFGYFNDRASADRVTNAFRHASELCAKAQPF
jgi:hypothetical protein